MTLKLVETDEDTTAATGETIPGIEDRAIVDADIALDDVGEPAEPAAPAPTESPEVPIHHGRCTEPGCGVGATYRPTASGHGFMLLERIGVDFEASFSVGPNGRPECPHGHGELGLADDLLPAADAFGHALRQSLSGSGSTTFGSRVDVTVSAG